MVKVGRDFTQNIRRKYDGETFEGVKRLFAYYYYVFFGGEGWGHLEVVWLLKQGLNNTLWTGQSNRKSGLCGTSVIS